MKNTVLFLLLNYFLTSFLSGQTPCTAYQAISNQRTRIISIDRFPSLLDSAKNLQQQGQIDSSIALINSVLPNLTTQKDSLVGEFLYLQGKNYLHKANGTAAANSFNCAAQYYDQVTLTIKVAKSRYNEMLAQFYYGKEKDKGLAPANWLIQHMEIFIENKKWVKLITGVYYELGRYYHEKNQLEMADSLLKHSAHYGRVYSTPLHNAYHLLALNSFQRGDFVNALAYTDSLFLESKRKQDTTAELWALSLNTTIYEYIENIPAAEHSLQRTIDIAKNIGEQNYALQHELWLVELQLKEDKNDIDLQKSFTRKVVQAFQTKDCTLYSIISRIFLEDPTLLPASNSTQYLNQLLEIANRCQDSEMIFQSQLIAADFYLKNGNTRKALTLLNKISFARQKEYTPLNRLHYHTIARNVYFANQLIPQGEEQDQFAQFLTDSLDKVRARHIAKLVSQQKEEAQKTARLRNENLLLVAKAQKNC